MSLWVWPTTKNPNCTSSNTYPTIRKDENASVQVIILPIFHTIIHLKKQLSRLWLNINAIFFLAPLMQPDNLNLHASIFEKMHFNVVHAQIES
jgi:hypothetical protein